MCSLWVQFGCEKDMASKKCLNKVVINSDVYAICLQHVLSTEKEEVMGLLLGNIDEGKSVSHIVACKIIRRLDKQPDRVEISPEQLLSASSYADELSAKLGQVVRVIGWYHSHPHITVWPSHVDISTQALYQMMEQCFVGIIFSVYSNNSSSKENQIQITAFQSITEGNKQNRLEVAIEIGSSTLTDYNLYGVSALPQILVQEEVENHPKEETKDTLIDLHNDAIKTLRHLHIMSQITIVASDCLEERTKMNQLRINHLEHIKKQFLDNR